MTEEQNVLCRTVPSPVAKNVIEFPAGLVNDLNLKKKEAILNAARRLWEETGYRARRIVKVDGPSSGGSSSDIITIVSLGLKKCPPEEGMKPRRSRCMKFLWTDPWLAQNAKRGA